MILAIAAFVIPIVYNIYTSQNQTNLTETTPIIIPGTTTATVIIGTTVTTTIGTTVTVTTTMTTTLISTTSKCLVR